MDGDAFLSLLQDHTSQLAGHGFGSPLYFTAFGIAGLVFAFTGKLWSRLLTKSQRGYLLLFLGNLVPALLGFAGYAAGLLLLGPALEANPLALTLTSGVIGAAALMLGMLLTHRALLDAAYWAGVFGLALSLAAAWGGIFVTNITIDAIESVGEGIEASVDERTPDVESALPDSLRP